MLLIVGTGFLGSYILKKASEITDEPILATVRDFEKVKPIKGVEYIELDVTVKEDIDLLAKKTEGNNLKVIYLAACHNIDYVYENYESAWKINIEALENFLCAFKNIHKLLFASTDCVYGENGNILRLTEEAPLKPVNAYGTQKAAAEKIIGEHNFTSVRLPYMLGPSLLNKPHFYDSICNRLKAGEGVEMIDGLTRCVLSYSQVAELLLRLLYLDSPLPAAVNIASDKSYSKYEMGCHLAEKNKLSSSLILKITEEEGQKFFKDKRASSTVMDNGLLKSILKIKELDWEV